MIELLEESDLDAIFRNSLHLASQGKFPLALDGLLDIFGRKRITATNLPGM